MQRNSVHLELSNKAFWDVNKNNLNFNTQANYIIKKIFEHGTWNDVLEITVFYGLPTVAAALKNATYLQESTLYFASLFLEVPKNEFACCTTKQFHPAR
jgi:hypothetical protein